MPQSLAQVYLHIVFSTKNRVPFLKDKKLQEETHAYLSGICKNLDSPSLLIGGTADHIHILCSFSRKYAISDLLRELKRGSSKFHWQQGFGVFSIGPSHISPLKKYIVKAGRASSQRNF